MNNDLKNLQKTREEIIEALKRNGVIIATRQYPMGTAIVLIDEATGTLMTWDGGYLDTGTKGAGDHGNV